MKKKKNIEIIILIIVLICIFGVCGYAVWWRMNPIVVTDMSILQVNFTIEPNTYMVVMDNDEDNVKSDISESKDSKSNKSSSKNQTTSSSKKKSSGGGTGSGTTVSQATYTQRIEIPRTRVNLVIYSDMTVKNMEKGVVILTTDNGLNQPGNTVISGHNLGNGRLFSNNHKIQGGDLIYITDCWGGRTTYSVYGMYWTDPNDAGYMERDTGGAREISLTTCTLDSTQRLIVLAREI